MTWGAGAGTLKKGESGLHSNWMTNRSFEDLKGQIDTGVAFVRKIDLGWKVGGTEELLDSIDKYSAEVHLDGGPGQDFYMLQDAKGKWYTGHGEPKTNWKQATRSSIRSTRANADGSVSITATSSAATTITPPPRSSSEGIGTPGGKQSIVQWDLSSAKSAAWAATKQRTLKELQEQHEV
jgi:hypothetical protein